MTPKRFLVIYQVVGSPSRSLWFYSLDSVTGFAAYLVEYYGRELLEVRWVPVYR